MEKISGIVRGNSRVTTVDNKNAAPARPGMPAFGRPAGETTAASPKQSSTASRAVALHNGIQEAKKAMSQERVIANMADQFFMSRVRRPAEEVQAPMPQVGEELEVVAATPAGKSTNELTLGSMAAPAEADAPQEYTPRGSYVDVRA